MLFFFLLVVMCLISSLDEIDICVELLADAQVLEWIVLNDCFCMNYQWLFPCCKIVIKIINIINEDKWKISPNRKIWKLICSFFVRPRIKKIKNRECEKLMVLNVGNNIFGGNPFYLRNISFKPNYWDLSWAIKMEFHIYLNIYNSIATKLCANLLNNCVIYLFCQWQK